MGTNPILPEVRKKAENPSFGSLLVRSGLIFLCAIALAVGMNRFFGWIAFESPDAQTLYGRIMDGRTEVRRMAMGEWVRLLQEAEGRQAALEALRPSAEQVTAMGPDFVRSAECTGRDQAFVGAQAALFGYGRDTARSKTFLRDFLKALKPDECLDARVMALVALTRQGIAEGADLELLLDASTSSDASLRKIGAFGLGQVPRLDPKLRESAEERLKILVQDSVEDVRWNAAIALSEAGRHEGVSVLKELLERAQNSGEAMLPGLLEVDRAAMKAALKTGDDELKKRVTQIAAAHSNLKLRQAAKEILKKAE